MRCKCWLRARYRQRASPRFNRSAFWGSFVSGQLLFGGAEVKSADSYFVRRTNKTRCAPWLEFRRKMAKIKVEGLVAFFFFGRRCPNKWKFSLGLSQTFLLPSPRPCVRHKCSNNAKGRERDIHSSLGSSSSWARGDSFLLVPKRRGIDL